jgi:hypothetical protein
LGINNGDRLYVIGSPKKGVVILLQEHKLEKFIEQMSLQVETFRKLKKSKDRK